jgi:hypothetical protein
MMKLKSIVAGVVLIVGLIIGNLVGMLIADAYIVKQKASVVAPPALVVGEMTVEEVIADEPITKIEESDWVAGEVELTLDGKVFAKRPLHFSPMATPNTAQLPAAWIFPTTDGWFALDVSQWSNSEVFLFLAALAQDGKIVWDTNVTDAIESLPKEAPKSAKPTYL